MLNGHMDAVEVKQMTIPPFEPRVEENRMYSRGSADMKGGLAVTISAAKAIEPYREVTNRLIKMMNEDAYQRKEEIVQALTRLLIE